MYVGFMLDLWIFMAYGDERTMLRGFVKSPGQLFFSAETWAVDGHC